MGFLRKIVKKVKKGVKKVARGIKKVVKKISKSKILKTIALVGAALVTGGAAVGAFGGTLKASQIGKALMAAQQGITNFLGPVQFLAKPFEMLGTAVGTGAGKVTDFLGATTSAGRHPTITSQKLALSTTAPPAGQINMNAMNFQPASTSYNPVTGQLTGGGFAVPGAASTTTASTTALTTSASAPASTSAGMFAKGSVAGDVVRGVTTGVLTGAAMQSIQGDPEAVGALGAGLGEERGIEMNPLDRSYVQAGIDYRDIYSQLTFGTADPGFLASRYPDLYQQQTLSLGGA